MRKILIGLLVVLLLIAAIPLGLLATGTIDSTSLRMVLNVMTGMGGPSANADAVKQRYQVPEGFTLTIFAQDLPRARFLRFTTNGDLLVSRPHAGDIMLLRRDENGDGHPDAVKTLVSGLKRPLGLDITDDWLYVAESNRIVRMKFDSERGAIESDPQPVVDGLTDNGNHWGKTIRIGPDKKLYLTQGSTCNICIEEDERRSTLMRFQLNGSEAEIVATGLRNSVGFDWSPWDGALYASDNGRDMLGNDFPPCELNRIEEGHFYGWPYFNGNNVPDPDMGVDPLAEQRRPTAPAHGFRAHNTPLGMVFVEGSNLPRDYRKAALVALHGSWNRSEPDGYKVVSLHWHGDDIEERDFLTGFNQGGDISGRPVDIAQGPDGAIYVSDDYAGAIYRIAYDINGDKAGDRVPAATAKTQLDRVLPGWLSTADLDTMSARGAALYRQYRCRSCHEEGENPVDLNGLSQRLGYNAIIDTLEAPQPPMPIFPLSETDRRELAVFLLTAL